jgi:iron uptake system EfeUOB component EfeO/EfeM
MNNKRISISSGLAALGVLVGVAAAAAAVRLAPAPIVVSDSACAPNWTAPGSGRTIFTVQNTAPHDFFSVQLVSGANPLVAANPVDPVNAVSAANADVYGQIRLIAPGTELPLDVVLAPGPYFVRCFDSDGNTFNSSIRHIGGPPVTDAHPASPVTPNQLALAMQTYRNDVMPLIGRLERDTDRLTLAVRGGRLAAARALWLPAHLDYARLGVAYGTFGKLDDEIDGRPLGLALGVRDPSFHGFLRLEYGLWHGQSRSVLDPVASALDRAVHSLLAQARSPAAMIWVNTDLPLRAHEILENTLQFELTGETNEGSGTNLATAWANVEGESFALDALGPLLRIRDPRLFAIATKGVTGLAAAFSAYEHPNGRWTSLAALTTRQREQLDSATSGLLEQLEQIPGELQLALTTASSGD